MKTARRKRQAWIALTLALSSWTITAEAQTPEPPAAPEAPVAADAPPPPAMAPAIARPVASPAPRAVVAGSPRAATSPAPVAAPRAPHPPRAGFEGSYLGVEALDLTPELREHFGAPREVGVMISRIQPESPAARSGLKPGDIVLEIGGRPTHDSWELSRAVLEGEPGEPVAIGILRDRRRQTLSASLERRRRDGFDVGSLLAPPAVPGITPMPGFPAQLEPALGQLRSMLDQPEFGEKIRQMQMRIDRDVEAKMKELEARLKELEEKLERSGR